MCDETSLCRVCLKTGEMIEIFEKTQTTTIAEKIVKLVKLQISPDDFPSTICNQCLNTLDICLKFIQLLKESDCKLRSVLRSILKQQAKRYAQVNPVATCESSKANDITTSDPNMTVKRIINNIQIQSPVIGEIMSRFGASAHQMTRSGEQLFYCKYCSKAFIHQSNLKHHVLTHTQRSASPNLGPHSRVGLRPVPPLVRIDQCPTKRRIQVDDNRDGVATRSEKPLKCTQCNATFQQMSALIVHVLIKHTGEKPYCCQHCPQKFATLGNWQRHIKQHSNEKSYECGTCGRPFSSPGLLTKHEASHSIIRPFKCTFCGKQLTRASNLKRHIITFHDSTIGTN